MYVCLFACLSFMHLKPVRPILMKFRQFISCIEKKILNYRKLKIVKNKFYFSAEILTVYI